MGLLQEIKVPLLSVNDTSLTVVDLAFTSGQPVKKGDTVLVFETSKTTYDVTAEANGYIQYLCEAGTDYEVNDVVARIFSTAAELVTAPVVEKAAKTEQAVPQDSVAHPATWDGDTLFSLEAIRLIESLKIDKSVFKGRDFVSRQDVEELSGLNGAANKKIPLPPGGPKKQVLPVDKSEVNIKKLSSGKKKEIAYLSEVQSTGLTSTINVIVETEGIFLHLNQSLTYLKNTLLPVIIYETARLLQKYPLLNACFTEEGIAYYNRVQVGFAVDIDKGLKVLKVNEADKKSISDIEADIIQLSNKYLDDTLHIDDLTGITFTITDLSSNGVAFFQPLVNMMNSGILGVSAIDEKLQRCILSLTFDHRVTEGKLVAEFLKDLKDRLESFRIKQGPHRVKNISCYKCKKSLADELGDVGFVRGLTLDGEEGYICQSCLKGF